MSYPTHHRVCTAEEIKANSKRKYTQHQNKLALYLIEKKVNITIMKRLLSKVNKPQHYKIERFFDEAVENVVRIANEQKANVLTIDKAKQLISQGIAHKPKRTLSKEEQTRTWKREAVSLLTAMNLEELKQALKVLRKLQKMKTQNNYNN